MHRLLCEREARGERIRVALVGAGRMGLGIAAQVGRTPGMELVSVCDLDVSAARQAAVAHDDASAPRSAGAAPPRGSIAVTDDPELALHPTLEVDVLVEASSSIASAARVCEAAIDRGCHVVLMNAEVDLAHGPRLARRATERGVVVTSDAGDQHGVLMRMIDEIRLWGIEITMAGNIKGFLDRHATAEGLAHEAASRKLDPIQCCAYSDGTKLNIEMALVANGTGLLPQVRGMRGPRLQQVDQVFEAFDLPSCADPGAVDYILGAEPDGGVFVVGRCEDPSQMEYLRYYKRGDGPFYLFYRPYHLCHLETPLAIAQAACHGEALLQPWAGRRTDVYAHAKRELTSGERIRRGIGGDQLYGLIERVEVAESEGLVPITALESDGDERARLRSSVSIDAPLRRDQVELPEPEAPH